MDTIADVVELASRFGFGALLLAYLAYRDKCDRDDRKIAQANRDRIDEADITSREKLATSLAALSIAITGRPGV